MTKFDRSTHCNRIRSLFAVCLLLFWPLSASANGILPPAFYILPIAWGLLIPIIFIEAHIANRIFGWGFRRSLIMSIIANMISTVIGIPVSLLSPLPILDYYDRLWFFPVLFVPLYAASVLSEVMIAKLFMELYVSRRPAWRWALIANAVTYLMISVLLGFWILTLYLTYPDHNEPASSLQP